LSGLSYDMTYYWHVRAWNGSAGPTYSNGSDTASWSFTTQVPPPEPPAAFNKTSPADGATEQPPYLTLTWEVSNGATSYQYCFDITNDDTCSGSWVDNGMNTSVEISRLKANTTYYWQVSAVNTHGTTYADISSWWSFTTLSFIEAYLPLVCKGD
jgi:hypothetical protein